MPLYNEALDILFAVYHFYITALNVHDRKESGKINLH